MILYYYNIFCPVESIILLKEHSDKETTCRTLKPNFETENSKENKGCLLLLGTLRVSLT